MARGPYYTTDENTRLLALAADHTDKTFVEIAQMAVSYGMFPDRTTKGLAAQLSRLMRQPEKEDDDHVGQISFDVLEIDALRRNLETVKTQLDELLSILIDKAELYEGEYFNSLKYSYAAVTKWLRRNYPERIAARLEELEDEQQN